MNIIKTGILSCCRMEYLGNKFDQNKMCLHCFHHWSEGDFSLKFRSKNSKRKNNVKLYNWEKDFHLNQQFTVINGYNIPKLNLRELPDAECEPFQKMNGDFFPYKVQHDFINFNPLDKYSKFKKSTPDVFQPHFVIHDGKCLSFQGYFRQDSLELNGEKYQYRKITLIYYLEDDTLTIIEPPIPNSGYPQGRLVRRGRIPKARSLGTWHWKDLNVGTNIEIYGITYHLSNCDAFTREYLRSQGIEVKEIEELPAKILGMDGMNRKPSYYYGAQEMTSTQDKLYKFLQYDRKVLRFYSLWNDRGRELDDPKHYKIYYYLIDDTVEIRQIKKTRGYNDQFSRLLSRTRLPKNQIGSAHGKLSTAGVDSTVEYYEPKDFMIGENLCILGKKFFIYDCDEFTRRYFSECLKIQQPKAISIVEECPEPVTKVIPPHTGIGQPEDTLQSCLSIMPKPPRKDVLHYIENTNKVLRYSAEFDTDVENDKDRKFIFQYSLADGKLSIYETRSPNSGFPSGYFLKSAYVPKFGRPENKQDYYTPADFIIGTSVNIFGRKFVITGADLAVCRYMERRPQKFGEQALESVRAYLQRKGILDSNAQQIQGQADQPFQDLDCGSAAN